MKFAVRIMLTGLALGILCNVYAQIVRGGVASLRVETVLAPARDLLFSIAKTVLKALALPFKILLSILKSVMQIPINLAWDKVPGVSSVADAPKITDLIPKLSNG